MLAAIRKSQARDPDSHIFRMMHQTENRGTDGRTYYDPRAETLHIGDTLIEIEL